MKNLNIFFFVVFFCMTTKIFAVDSPKNDFSFKAGEKSEYDLFYNWGFIWIKAANTTFTVKEKTFNGKPVYELKMASSTIKTFNKFDLRDTIVSYVNKKTLSPYYVFQSSKEPDYYAKNKSFFFKIDTTWVTVVEKERKKGTTKDTILYNKYFSDVVSTLYRIRNTDATKLKLNEKIPMSIIFTDEIYDLYYRFVGKETVKLRNGKSYNCLIIRTYLADGKLFDKGEGMTIWVSDDQNHIPLMVESKMKVGSLKAVLEKIENNRYPMTSEVKSK